MSSVQFCFRNTMAFMLTCTDFLFAEAASMVQLGSFHRGTGWAGGFPFVHSERHVQFQNKLMPFMSLLLTIKLQTYQQDVLIVLMTEQ